VSTPFAEQDLAVIRKHGSVLFLPVILLGATGGVFFFVESKLNQSWQHQALLGFVLVFALIFWLLPSIRFFTNKYEITSNRVVVHKGLTGNRTEEAAWGELTGVSVSKSFGAWLRGAGDVRLHREFGSDLVLSGVPKAKRLSRDLELFMAKRVGK
jgi:uncharacterized membrane protein YdbT with pleckstrin-like domain